MRLRDLELRDASRMLEWMHDEDVIKNLRTDFRTLELKDAEHFIIQSKKACENIHKAIVSDENEYMGTVSLKQIDYKKGNAEFAITVCRDAMSKGYSW